MEVQLIRKLLEQLLDYHFDFYLTKLRDWFANKMSKEQFDTEMAAILRGEVLQLHNQLIMAILIQSSAVSIPSANLRPLEWSPFSNDTNSQSLIQKRDQVSSGDMLLEIDKGHMSKQSNLDPESEPTILFQIKSVTTSNSRNWRHHLENSNVVVETTRRFPDIFTQEFLAPGAQGYRHRLSHFDIGINSCSVSMPKEANLYGRFLTNAWSRFRLDSVQPNALNFAIGATIDHIKNIVVAIMRQRKAFRMRDGRYIHSIGCPYPNPYLRQGQQLFDDTYSSETAKLAEVMQIPAFLPTREEKERLAALEVSSAVLLKYQHLKTKSTLSDLYEAMQCDRKLIPNRMHLVRLKEFILQKSRGYGDAYSDYDDADEVDGRTNLASKTVYPIILY